MEIIRDVLVFLIATGVFSVLLRSLFKLLLDRDIERMKANSNKSLEAYKVLHGERMYIIKEIYKKIDRANRALVSLVNPLQLVGEPTEEEKRRDFVEKYNDFNDFFGENRIFFNDDLATQIETLRDAFLAIWRKWNSAKVDRNNKVPNIEKWGQAWEDLQKEVPELKKILEDLFRGEIGVE